MAKFKVTRKVKSGAHGTIKEGQKYGDRLLAVRYLSNGEGGYMKTVETIV